MKVLASGPLGRDGASRENAEDPAAAQTAHCCVTGFKESNSPRSIALRRWWPASPAWCGPVRSRPPQPRPDPSGLSLGALAQVTLLVGEPRVPGRVWAVVSEILAADGPRWAQAQLSRACMLSSRCFSAPLIQDKHSHVLPVCRGPHVEKFCGRPPGSPGECSASQPQPRALGRALAPGGLCGQVCLGWPHPAVWSLNRGPGMARRDRPLGGLPETSLGQGPRAWGIPRDSRWRGVPSQSVLVGTGLSGPALPPEAPRYGY